MKVFAFYEKNFANEFKLVCFYNELPQKSVNANNRERIGPFVVTPDLLNEDGTANLVKIAEKFPMAETQAA